MLAPILLTLLLTGPLPGQQPYKLGATVPSMADEYTIVPITVDAPPQYVLVEVRSSLFDFAPVEELAPDLDKDGKVTARRWGFTGPPAKYLVEITGYGPDGLDKLRATCTIDKPNPPPPTPDPNPPPPPPTPEPGTRWLLVVREAGDVAFAEAQLYAQLRTAPELSKHKLKIVDQDAKDQDGGTVDALQPWLNRAKGHTLPYLFISDNSGKVLYEGALPADKAAFLDLLKKEGG